MYILDSLPIDTNRKARNPKHIDISALFEYTVYVYVSAATSNSPSFPFTLYSPQYSSDIFDVILTEYNIGSWIKDIRAISSPLRCSAKV